MTKNADCDKYSYSGYGVRFDGRGSFSLSDGSGFGKNVIIFGADKGSSAHIDNKKKDMLILGKRPTNGLHDTNLRLHPTTIQKVALLHACFHVFKLYNWYQIAQGVSY